jgi:hypothetical protein
MFLMATDFTWPNTTKKPSIVGLWEELDVDISDLFELARSVMLQNDQIDSIGIYRMPANRLLSQWSINAEKILYRSQL